MDKKSSQQPADMPRSFSTLRQANAEAIAHALRGCPTINERALAERADMSIEDMRFALDDLAVAGQYIFEVQDVARIARCRIQKEGVA